MKQITIISIAACAAVMLFAGCSKQSAEKPALDTTAPRVTLSELIKGAKSYHGKTVTVSGRFGGMCADGADFYFKDNLDLIEVIPPTDGMPKDLIVGTPLTVQGLVVVKTHEGEGAHEAAAGEKESHEEAGESEVKVQAQVIQISRS